MTFLIQVLQAFKLIATLSLNAQKGLIEVQKKQITACLNAKALNYFSGHTGVVMAAETGFSCICGFCTGGGGRAGMDPLWI